MTEGGLRDRKKQRTRQHIADTAARLFGEHGYEQVTVADVARAAEVSQQTVYNYFTGKQDLVLDREAEIRDRLTRLITERAPGTTPAAALRPAARAEVQRLRVRSADEMFGDLAMLCATSATVRRLALEARDRQADALAAAIRGTSSISDHLTAKAQAAALLTVFQAIVDQAGRRRLEGASGERIADELAPAVEAAFDDLEQRFSD